MPTGLNRGPWAVSQRQARPIPAIMTDVKALLTGATQGIGMATAYRLCPAVDVLVLHGLEPRADRLVDELRRRSPGTEVVYLPADYERLRDVGALAAAVRERLGGLELLINNAGRPGPPTRRLSADGHELTFQANYLAPVALTSGLLPVLEQADRARVVNVASATHYSARLSLEDLELEQGYSSVSAYAHSKLALVTYTCWLARQLDASRVEAVSVHPGVISTGLLHAMFGAGGDSVERGARNVVSAAQAPPGVNGTYFDEDSPARPNPEALEIANQDRLVEATARALDAAGVPAPRPGDARG
jgi:NAD(P)-dependent dehydrogenase (short-subunit alcohol dehydrogenase family)